MNMRRNLLITFCTICGLTWAGWAMAQDAAEQVTDLFEQARNSTSALAPGLINITEGVIDASETCEQTFDAIMTATSLLPQQAPAIVSTLSLKKDCNCNDGGIWVEQQLHEWLLPEHGYSVIDAEPSYSCTQVSVRGGITGLPENAAYEVATSDVEKQQIVRQMAQAVHDILYETLLLQSNSDWECGAVDINIAAAMQGIGNEAFRAEVYAELANLFVADTGDGSFGCGGAIALYLSQFPDSPVIVQKLYSAKGIRQPDLASPN